MEQERQQFFEWHKKEFGFTPDSQTSHPQSEVWYNCYLAGWQARAAQASNKVVDDEVIDKIKALKTVIRNSKDTCAKAYCDGYEAAKESAIIILKSSIQALGSSQQDPIAVEVCGIIRDLLLKECPEIPCPAFLDDHVANLIISYKKLKVSQQVENGYRELFQAAKKLQSKWNKFPIDFIITGGKQLDPVRDFFGIFRDELLPILKAQAAINGDRV